MGIGQQSLRHGSNRSASEDMEQVSETKDTHALNPQANPFRPIQGLWLFLNKHERAHQPLIVRYTHSRPGYNLFMPSLQAGTGRKGVGCHFMQVSIKSGLRRRPQSVQ